MHCICNKIKKKRVDANDKAAFDAFCDSVGLSTSSVLNLFVKKVINEGRIPFDITMPKEVSLNEGLKAFYALREEAKNNGLQNMKSDEINNEIDLARKGK